MSLPTAIARVQHIQGLLAGAAGGTPVPAAGQNGQGFNAQLVRAVGQNGGVQPVTGDAPVTGAPAPTGPGANTPFAAEIDAAAARHRIDPALLRGLIRAESNFNPKATSPAGAKGLTQLMPGTARGLGVTNPYDPVQAINGGAKYLRQMLDKFGGDTRKALAGYNAGPGAVKRYGGIPPYAETRAYVTKILALLGGAGDIAMPSFEVRLVE